MKTAKPALSTLLLDPTSQYLCKRLTFYPIRLVAQLADHRPREHTHTGQQPDCRSRQLKKPLFVALRLRLTASPDDNGEHQTLDQAKAYRKDTPEYN